MESKQKIFSKLLLKLKKEKINIPLALVGSAVNQEKYNDLDFLMIADDISLTIEKIKLCFNKYDITIIDDAIKILDYCNCEISIAIYETKSTEMLVNQFMSGEKMVATHRSWSIGYWLTEGFINDLSEMYILMDKNNYLSNLQIKATKKSLYAKNKILKDCIEEIKIKQEVLNKTSIESLEYSFLKNDLILVILRGIYVMDDLYLNGFKRLPDLIKKSNSHYKKKLLDFINNGNIDSLTKIIEGFSKYTSWNNKIYLGTWQYSGDFKKLSEIEIINLIKCAKKLGINKFDTALVYGKGAVEKLLSKITDEKDEVLSKIPAKTKPSNEKNKPIEDFYTYEHMKDCVLKSLTNLNRKYLDICLLHNWNSSWNDNPQILNWLLQLKQEKLVKRIGISLPNQYNETLPNKVLSIIDVIEAPYNEENNWVENDIELYKEYGIEIILRSLFIQGNTIKKDKVVAKDIIKNAMKFKTSLVIGMTSSVQIKENIKVLK